MKKLLLIASILGVCALAPKANAQTPRSTVFQVGALTNCNVAGLGSAINACEVRSLSQGLLGVEGYNLLTLEIKFDAAGATGVTGYTFQLEACSEGMDTASCTDDTDWYLVQGEAYSSGTLTLADATMSKTVTANTDHYGMWSVGINYKRLRVANVTALTAASASDKITIKAWLATSPAF